MGGLAFGNIRTFSEILCHAENQVPIHSSLIVSAAREVSLALSLSLQEIKPQETKIMNVTRFIVDQVLSDLPNGY